jgi:tetratricopeptide (TPR) repeat protein
MKKILSNIIAILTLLSITTFCAFSQTLDEFVKQSKAAMDDDKSEEAVILCEKALKLEPQNASVNLLCGLASFSAKKYQNAEKYLEVAEGTIKNNAELYAKLGAAHYGRHRGKISEADFKISIDYLTRAINLDANYIFSYIIRPGIYYEYYKGDGLRNNTKLKETFYSDLQQQILLNPVDLEAVYQYAHFSVELGDHGQALPLFSHLLESPKTRLEVANQLCGNAVANIEQAAKNKENITIWDDAILLMNRCKISIGKLETNQLRKKQKIAKFNANLIRYQQLNSNKNPKQ